MVGWCITSRIVITTHDELMEFVMKFVSFEDTTAIFETNIFLQAFRRYAHLIDLHAPFVIRGRVTEDHGCVTLNAASVDTRLFYKISRTDRSLSPVEERDIGLGVRSCSLHSPCGRSSPRLVSSHTVSGCLVSCHVKRQFKGPNLSKQ